MKQIITSAAILLLGVACQNQSINESRATEANGEAIMVNRLFTEVPINNSNFCNSNAGENCAEKIQLLQRQLMRLNPIPVPDKGQEITLSLTEATSRYKAFIVAHEQEPVLPLFKQLYARILLNQYGAVASKNYLLVTYYVQQMIETNSLDFNTIAKAMTALQNHIPATQFDSMLTSVTKAAQEHKDWQEKTIADLSNEAGTASRKHSGTLSTTFMKEGRQRVLAEYKKSTISADLAQLRQLQKQAID